MDKCFFFLVEIGLILIIARKFPHIFSIQNWEKNLNYYPLATVEHLKSWLMANNNENDNNRRGKNKKKKNHSGKKNCSPSVMNELEVPG